jgi:hypothetical protein
MKRRDFCRTSAGLLAVSILPGMWSCQRQVKPKNKFSIRPFTGVDSLAPILQVTPAEGYYLHTYYDVTPFSPSQRYFAVTKVPFQEKLPVFGDTAEICVIDLQEETIETVYETKVWGFQTAANLNWGQTDRFLYLNDVIDGKTVCVRVDRESEEVKAYEGPMYHVAPDESCVVSFPQEYWAVTQLGLGTPPKDYNNLPSLPPGAVENEGIWRTDLRTNEKTLLVSLADAAATLPHPPPKDDYTFYFWHSKFNKQGTLISQVLRCQFMDGWNGRNPMTLVFKADGSEIYYCLPDYHQWGMKGGHPNWEPNGEYLTRVMLHEDGLHHYGEFKYDGTEFHWLSEKLKAQGHPTMHPNGRHMITDDNRVSEDSAQNSLVLIDFAAEKQEVICTLPSYNWKKKFTDNVYRIDGHPVWDRKYKRVSFQAAPEGRRQLFIIGLEHLLV